MNAQTPMNPETWGTQQTMRSLQGWMAGALLGAACLDAPTSAPTAPDLFLLQAQHLPMQGRTRGGAHSSANRHHWPRQYSSSASSAEEAGSSSRRQQAAHAAAPAAQPHSQAAGAQPPRTAALQVRMGAPWQPQSRLGPRLAMLTGCSRVMLLRWLPEIAAAVHACAGAALSCCWHTLL
jgi:hypothetical protein